MSDIARIFENEESLRKRLDDLTALLETLEQAPSQEAFRIATKLFNEFEVMLNFFHRNHVIESFHTLKTRALNLAVEHNGILMRAINPDPYEVPEVRDFITRGIFECNKCKGTRVAIRISNIPKPIKTPYKCLTCGHFEVITVLPTQAAAVIKSGKELQMDHIPLPKQKEAEL